ncbi:MAG: hypothetical protein ACE14O_00990 [Candidatus Cloacimonadaceae bacterium]
MKEEKSTQTLPDYPNNIGKVRKVKDINGHEDIFIITDEIKFQQHNNPHKLIYFQKLEHQSDKMKKEYRLGYYMIGAKGKTQGKWVWGQYSLMIPAVDLRKLLKKAHEKGWDV